MSDLISRQAAIDIIEDFPHGDVWNVESMEEMVDRIKQLPSALSEEDCETCKHGYFGDTYCNNCKVRFPSHYERRTDE